MTSKEIIAALFKHAAQCTQSLSQEDYDRIAERVKKADDAFAKEASLRQSIDLSASYTL